MPPAGRRLDGSGPPRRAPRSSSRWRVLAACAAFLALLPTGARANADDESQPDSPSGSSSSHGHASSIRGRRHGRGVRAGRPGVGAGPRQRRHEGGPDPAGLRRGRQSHLGRRMGPSQGGGRGDRARGHPTPGIVHPFTRHRSRECGGGRRCVGNRPAERRRRRRRWRRAHPEPRRD